MKFLLKLLYFLLAIMIIILLAGMFLPKDVRIESAVSIGASTDIVFDQVNDLKNWENWSPWLEADSTIKIEYGGMSAGAGASYSWTSNNSGSGSQQIDKSVPNRTILTTIDFGGQGGANGSWNFESGDDHTVVSWAFIDENMKYFERYFMYLFRNTIQNSLNSGLENLKNISEELRLSRVSEVELVNLEIQPCMAIIDSSDMANMAVKMADMFEKLTAYMKRRELKPTGAPFNIYYNWNPDGIIKYASGFPIEKKTWGWKQYTYLELPEGKAATITHWGMYSSPKPWLSIDQYLKDNGLEMNGAPWMVYLSDPSVDPDTSRWKLQVFYPVQ